MLKWATPFLLIASVAPFLGPWVTAASAVEVAKILFFVFLMLFLVTSLVGTRR
jgi:uncharacterized membrane protein YtjA (UPF0391 family)